MPAFLRRLLLLVFVLGSTLPMLASPTPVEQTAAAAAQHEIDSSPRDGNLPSYQLAPDALATAKHLEHVRALEAFGGTLWSVLVLVGLLSFGAIARFERLALRYRRVFPQGYRFVLLLLLSTTLLALPLDMYSHAVRLHYGLSVQGWGSWFGDQAKGLALTYGIGGLLAALAYRSLQITPRWWWLRFWAIAMPFALATLLISPYVIDPLFNHFEPLNATHPELVQKLQQVADRGHMGITPDRMFLMKASEKSTTMNAYVTGFGPSKRVVVWDTSIGKGTTDQLLFIFGHESGHYVLNHVLWGTLQVALGGLLLLYLCHLLLGPVLRRFGTRWQVNSPQQWGAIAVLMLLFSVLSALATPVTMALSRSKEHAADVYGQEAIHGLVANPQQAAQGAFQVLGATSFDDPNPSPLLEELLYSHPAIGRRAAFAAHYDPWSSGAQPRYFSK